MVLKTRKCGKESKILNYIDKATDKAIRSELGFQVLIDVTFFNFWEFSGCMKTC